MIATWKQGALLALLLAASLAAPIALSFSFEYKVIRQAEVYAPAVTSSGTGVLSKVTLVIAGPGTGKVFFSALPYTEVDTQGAARIAAEVAARIAGEEFDNWDYYIIMEASSPIIGGPSAGALMASAFLLLFRGESPRNDTTMTGMINPDGLVGPVGGLKEKIEAAASQGFHTFLIPRGQRYYSYPVVTEERTGIWIIRRISYETLDLVEYGRKLNVNVIEVGTILEAASYLGGITVNASATMPSWAVNVSGATQLLVNETAGAIGDAYGYVRRISTAWWAAALINNINELNAALSTLTRVLTSRQYYAFGKLLELYGDAYRMRVYAGLLSGDISPSEVVDELGKSLREFQSPACSPGICNALASGYIAYAKMLYDQLLSLGNSTSGPSYIEIASYASLIKKLVMESRTTALIGGSMGAYCYGNSGNSSSVLGSALAIYSYISRLASEMGLQQGYLSDADNLNAVLVSGKAENNYEIYGTSLLLIASSISGFTTALGNNLTIYLSSQERLLAYLLRRAGASPLALLYYQIARESHEVGDDEIAEKYMALSTALAIYASGCELPPASIQAEPVSSGTLPNSAGTPAASPGPASNGASAAPIYYAAPLAIAAALIAALLILIKPKRQ